MSIQLFKKWTQAVVNSDWGSKSSIYAEDIVNLNSYGTTNEDKVHRNDQLLPRASTARSKLGHNLDNFLKVYHKSNITRKK